MNHFITAYPAAPDAECLELAHGTPLDLWLGVEGESEEDRAARLEAARDILADYPDLMGFVVRITVAAIETEATDLLRCPVDGDR
ncbi:hypothetical protein [Streptomyces cucumeris]|uniref:hypothetical protein n=1 Tax=Streptomyces cucumeris TaxID=2962890 RepID=UPI0020C84048|nr:hypothetical protein [Streptomyces sp. NEAU-Y11]MCP9207108.1 hypothetical protein [Streptomyces sp. NEAU-Y11]